ncbi:50S ribosomal protein L10 [Halonotius aquaticus]|uniref:Large ribosomal subunit protein uL10 n=1 Tax=Halonotius aquaticus TaxID=2216978 RepID=A0A3A6Q0N3_9EURY|nr:50S ribosomal protein L10 [Halonotius aquaticus]RJX42714.1 50S ribosomal protein L10 [Halonotius aquaticus]
MSSSEAVRKTETIPQWKQDEVDELTDFIERYASVGIVGVEGIPSRQLQSMRRELHGSAEVRMSRNTLVVRALEAVNDGVEQLTEHVGGQIALIGTNDNPFALFQQLEASKTPAPISAGEVAPNDIVIPEGDTGVDPGPFVGELQQIGADARIEEGSIQVLSDSTVLSAGETVDADLENVLSELGIEPKEVGLDLKSVYSEGVLFAPEELEIDIDDYRADIQSAAAAARNLSVNAEYPTAQTAPTLIAKATGEAKSVALAAAVESPDVVDDLIGKADAQVRALASEIDDPEALPEEFQDLGDDDAEEADEADDGEAEEANADDAQTDDEDEAEADDGDDDSDAGAGLDML